MNKELLKRNSLIFGLGIAIVCIVVALVQYYLLGKSPFGKYKLPAFGVNIIFIFFSIWYYRINNGGLLSFTEGFSVGFLTNLVGVLITAIFFYIFTEFIDNQAIVLWVKENIQNIEKIKVAHIKNFGLEEYQNLITQARKIPTPFQVFVDEISKKQLVVVAITIFTMILRKHNVVKY